MRSCPSCGVPMREVRKHDVLIDLCPGCHGVWLDRGELEKILAAERGVPDYDTLVHGRPEPRHGHPHGYHHDYHYKKKKKHSFLEVFGELFD
ncbi:MAG: zf-TFIIB domain-containing protein [Firmicutes bacterium]|nr:zf-TFIIB domain-containing protein [Bacillota bacterium]